MVGERPGSVVQMGAGMTDGIKFIRTRKQYMLGTLP